MKMSKKNFCIGMCMGVIAGCFVALTMKPKKRCMKSAIGKTLRTMSEIVDSISDAMGW